MDLKKNKIYNEDANIFMDKMAENSIDLIITSPPYFGLRHYGGETIGREEDPREYVNNFNEFAERMRRVLKTTGTLYLNIGDVYFGTKGFSRNAGKASRKTDHHYNEHKITKEDGKYLQHKQLLLLPSRIAIAMQDSGWVLRNDIIWHKPNAMPTNIIDRRLAMYEHIFMFTKSKKGYYYDIDMSKKLKCHKDVVEQKIGGYDYHQASYPLPLIEPLVQVSARKNDLVYDPFMGSGTTAIAAIRHGRNYIGTETNKDFIKDAEKRIEKEENSLFKT